MTSEFHEEKLVTVRLAGRCTAGAGNIAFRKLGFNLHYDVYAFAASHAEPWQSDQIADVDLYFDGAEVDAQDDFDQVVMRYLLASRPSSDIDLFLDLVEKVSSEFGGTLEYAGREMTKSDVRGEFVSCVDSLLKEWGEEPGAESLAMMIEENYSH
jgi:hypothetical protein